MTPPATGSPEAAAPSSSEPVASPAAAPERPTPPLTSAGQPTASGARLRPMTRSDLPEVASLEAELFGGEAWSEDLLASELEVSQDQPGAPADRCYVVVEAAGLSGRPPATALPANRDDAAAGYRLLGYAGLWLGDGHGDADLLTIATVPAARRHGVARLMLRALVGRAREAGCATVLLEVRASNAAAQALYVSEGFERIGVRRRYYTGPVEDALVMRLALRDRVGPVGAEAVAAQ